MLQPGPRTEGSLCSPAPPAPQRAVEVMCVVPKRCNDMMNVGRLQGFDVMWLLFKLTALSGMLGRHLQKANSFCLVCCLLSLSLTLSDTMFQLFWVHLISFWGRPSPAQSPAPHGGSRQASALSPGPSAVEERASFPGTTHRGPSIYHLSSVSPRSLTPGPWAPP